MTDDAISHPKVPNVISLPDWNQECAPVMLPCEITGMEIINNRLFITLVDGRTVDMTDWFANELPPLAS